MEFLAGHKVQTAVVGALIVYSGLKKKLTLDGLLAAALTAGIHMIHPWGVFFYLLVGFFAVGTVGTKINHSRKATLTQSATGGVGGEGARNYAQVLANSGVASILILLHLYYLEGKDSLEKGFRYGDVIPFGIAASYAAAASDTLSSELGILSTSSPILITAPWRRVPRGTNGGVTITGLLAGFAGALVISLLSNFLMPYDSSWTTESIYAFVGGIVGAGMAGTLLDSLLGALVQATVEDKGTGRVVEGDNGRRVKVNEGGSRVQRGMDLLNNNGVNFVMTALVAGAGMVVWKSVAGS